MTDQERYHAARRDPALVVIEGFHALKHAVRFGADIVDAITDDPSRIARLAASLAPDLQGRVDADGFVRVVSTAAFDALSPAPHPTRVIALAQRPALTVADVFDAGSAPIVLLDDPRHAGNIGAAVRVAAAAGASALFVTGDADPWQPAAVRGGAGLQFALPVARINAIPATSRNIVGLDPEGHELDAATSALVPCDSVLVFGSERDGISAALSRRLQQRVRIPMRAGVSSLNLATAVAIMLYHQAFSPGRSRDAVRGT